MKLLKNRDVNISNWQKLLDDNPYTSAFQTPEYYNFYNSLSKQYANVYAIAEEDKYIALCVATVQKELGLKAKFSKRGIIYGGCIISPDHPKALDALLQFVIKDLKHKVIYIEVRNYHDYTNLDSVVNRKWKRVPYYNYQIDLRNKESEDILRSMPYNRRREIKLSLQEGATITEAANYDEVEYLYEQLHKLYLDRVKLPLPRNDFFHKLYNMPFGKVFVVKHQGNIIGGSFCIYYPERAIYTYYYYGARAYHPKIFPNHLAILGAIQFALKNGLQEADLMGAGKPGEEYGVRKYKEAFGGELREQNRYLYICKPRAYRLGKLGIQIMKRINI